MAFLAPFVQGLTAALGVGQFLLGSKANKETQRANEQSAAFTREQIDFQKELAKNQIQWRMEDAMKAGLHPTMGAGIIPYAYSPVSGPNYTPKDYSYVQQMGQDLSRATMAAQSERERKEAIAVAAGRQAVEDVRDAQRHEVDMERANLENDILRNQLARASSAQVGPGAPERVDVVRSGSRTRPGTVREIPSTVIQGSMDQRAREPGTITSYQYARTPDGGLSLVQSEQMKERTEDDVFAQTGWNVRHFIGSNFGGIRPPSRNSYPLGPGQYWAWNGFRQAFYPYDPRTNEWIINGRRVSRWFSRRRQ